MHNRQKEILESAIDFASGLIVFCPNNGQFRAEIGELKYKAEKFLLEYAPGKILIHDKTNGRSQDAFRAPRN